MAFLDQVQASYQNRSAEPPTTMQETVKKSVPDDRNIKKSKYLARVTELERNRRSIAAGGFNPQGALTDKKRRKYERQLENLDEDMPEFLRMSGINDPVAQKQLIEQARQIADTKTGVKPDAPPNAVDSFTQAKGKSFGLDDDDHDADGNSNPQEACCDDPSAEASDMENPLAAYVKGK
jgi:hypothetical protein